MGTKSVHSGKYGANSVSCGVRERAMSSSLHQWGEEVGVEECEVRSGRQQDWNGSRSL